MPNRLTWFLLAIVTALVTLSFPAPANADMRVTLQAAPGTDLADVSVGDTVSFDVIGTSSDPTEVLLYEEPHVFYTGGTLNLTSFTYDVTSTLLIDSPVIATLSFQATAAGLGELFIGWPDCTGLPSNTFGCAVTNLEAFRPADSNTVSFSISTPEPSTLLLLGMGLSLGLLAYRRK